jgi:hypothetical protein
MHTPLIVGPPWYGAGGGPTYRPGGGVCPDSAAVRSRRPQALSSRTAAHTRRRP